MILNWKKIILLTVLSLLYLSPIVEEVLAEFNDDTIGYRVSWIEYDDNSDGNVDRIDISYSLRYHADVYAIIDSWIHVKAWDNNAQEFFTVDFIWDHQEFIGKDGNGAGFCRDFRPKFNGQFQITVKVFTNKTLQHTEIIDWNGWKSDLVDESLKVTWIESDSDHNGLKDTLNIYFYLEPNTTGLIEVIVDSNVFPLDEFSPQIGDVLKTYQESDVVESTLDAIISVNITLKSPLTGNLIILNTISLQTTYLSFQYSLDAIYWEDVYKFQANEPNLKVQIKSGFFNLSTTTHTNTRSLEALDEQTLIIVSIYIGIITKGIRRKNTK